MGSIPIPSIPKNMITQEELKNILHYDSESGIFTWLKTINSRAVKGTNPSSIRSGYLSLQYNKQKYYQHRLAFLYMTGRIPKEVDHINRDKLDNRWNNLRASNRSSNLGNINKYSNNKVGYKGVRVQNSKYRAEISKEGIKYHLGYFSDIVDAAKAYDKKAKELYGKSACTNF